MIPMRRALLGVLATLPLASHGVLGIEWCAVKAMLAKQVGTRVQLSRYGVGWWDKVLRSEDNKSKTLSNQISQWAWRDKTLPNL